MLPSRVFAINGVAFTVATGWIVANKNLSCHRTAVSLRLLLVRDSSENLLGCVVEEKVRATLNGPG